MYNGTPTDSSETIDAELLDRLLKRRHSCRAFLPDEVPEAIVHGILTTASRVPSWCNAQPWEAVLCVGDSMDRMRRELVLEAARDPEPDIAFPVEYAGVYQERRRECAAALYASVGIAMGDREGSRLQAMQNFHFFGAPHAAIVTTERDLGPYGAIDCGAFISMFALAAESRGVATIAQAAIATRSKLLHRILDIPNSRQIICAISFGFEDRGHPANGFRTARANFQEFTRWLS